MRALFSIVSLLMVLAIVGVLVKKQFSSTASLPVIPASTSAPAALGVTSPNATPQEQGRQLQQQVREAVETGMQPRVMPDGQ